VESPDCSFVCEGFIVHNSPICQDMDGTTWPVNSGPRPPFHINACHPGTGIITKRGIIPIIDVVVGDYVKTHTGSWKRVYAVMARPHDGIIRKLINNFGSSVRLTHEHPILTKEKGWINAGGVNKGDIFFNDTQEFSGFNVVGESPLVPQAVLINSYNIKTRLTEELISFGIFSFTPGVSSSIKLNGRIPTNYEIGIIGNNSILSCIFNAKRIKNISKKRFVLSRVISKCINNSLSAFFYIFNFIHRIINKHSFRAFFAIFFSQIRSVFNPMITPRCSNNMLFIIFKRLQPAFNLNPIPFTCGVKGGFPDAHVPFDTSNTSTFFKMFNVNKLLGFFLGKDHDKNSFFKDKWLASTCTSIVDYHYKGYVVNLGVEKDETYIADGFVVHNCRTTTAPVVKSWKELGIDIDEAPAGTRASMNGQVPEKTTYNEWLKGQSNKVQDSILGAGTKNHPGRAQLFREGKFDVHSFVDRKTGRHFTLSDLAAEDGIKVAKKGTQKAITDAKLMKVAEDFTPCILPGKE